MINKHYGRRIYTLDDLYHSYSHRKSVISSSCMFSKPKPASWVINMSGQILHRLIKSGLYVYITKKEIKNGDY